MKLNDLYKWQEFVLVETPELGPDQALSPTIDDFYERFLPTGQTIENFELWGFSVGDQRAFALVKDKEFYTVLVAKTLDDFPGEKRKETLVIQQTETPEKFRGREYSPALIDGLAKLGYRIISDSTLSKSAFAVWNKLLVKRKDNIKFWDTNKHKFTDEDPIDKENIRYVLEHVMFTQDRGILDDRVFWIIADHQTQQKLPLQP